MKNCVIFQGKLACYPETATELGFLTKNHLFWQHQGIKQELCLDDVVGTTLINQGDNNRPCLVVSAYPKQTVGLLVKKQRRILREYYFTCEDLPKRSQWQKAINNTLVGKAVDADIKCRKLQIVINPNSGQKLASKVFEQVRPLLDRSNLTYTVTETSSAADTKNLVRNLNLSALDGLVIVGGDGTIHDAIAGLMSRGDRETAIKLPLGIIPGGTGNGLCKSILESARESYNPLTATFMIAKGKQQSFDLASVTQNGQEYYSFLSLAWGLISDVDIESEKLKFLGALRFDVYAVMLLSLLRTYKGRFSYLPHPDFEQIQKQENSSLTGWQVMEDDFIFLWAMNTPWAAHDMNITPNASLNDGAIDVLVMRQGTSRWELLQALLRCGKGKHLNLPHMEYYKVSAFKLEPLTDEGILVVDGEPVDYTPIEMKIMPNLAVING
ncbi:sphingosine kinase [Pleurocapsa sp. CCALA 161]|uniref:diacylglycerol kinase family protein n=1 Tax=Pleurocapsa sp. CCALA 161 TaxID=2107688 RepID=UPI000D069334|nr:diacylglycerol kinase family protein [Pleurocapsa sp. CCALA 161]PSB11402.1 sphingosine kinase [Pleurocapsa sp. CCALA 161]